MHRGFRGGAWEHEGIFYFGMPLASCGELWYSDFVGIWHGYVDASWVALPTQLNPARGRKFVNWMIPWRISKHNLSPQGDEEGNVGIALYYVITFQYCNVRRE